MDKNMPLESLESAMFPKHLSIMFSGVIDVGVETLVPLFHTSLVPDLMQVYLTPAETVVEFSVLHFAPAFIAAFEAVIG